MLTTNEHDAAARRAANRQRVAGAVVLAATDTTGTAYTMVLCAKEPGKAYLVARDKKTQAWTCSCFAARWHGLCDHLEAVRLHDDETKGAHA